MKKWFLRLKRNFRLLKDKILSWLRKIGVLKMSTYYLNIQLYCEQNATEILIPFIIAVNDPKKVEEFVSLIIKSISSTRDYRITKYPQNPREVSLDDEGFISSLYLEFKDYRVCEFTLGMNLMATAITLHLVTNNRNKLSKDFYSDLNMNIESEDQTKEINQESSISKKETEIIHLAVIENFNIFKRHITEDGGTKYKYQQIEVLEINPNKKSSKPTFPSLNL